MGNTKSMPFCTCYACSGACNWMTDEICILSAEEWLMKRFPECSEEDVQAALLTADGHEGKAASILTQVDKSGEVAAATNVSKEKAQQMLAEHGGDVNMAIMMLRSMNARLERQHKLWRMEHALPDETPAGVVYVSNTPAALPGELRIAETPAYVEELAALNKQYYGMVPRVKLQKLQQKHGCGVLPDRIQTARRAQLREIFLRVNHTESITPSEFKKALTGKRKDGFRAVLQ